MCRHQARCLALGALLLVINSACVAGAEPARVLVSYSAGSRSAVSTSWRSALSSKGVEVLTHSTADRFVVLEAGEGSAAELAAAARKLPGVEDVERDHRLTLHVMKSKHRGGGHASPGAATDVCPGGGECEFSNSQDGSGNETLPYGIKMVQGDSAQAGPSSLVDAGVSVCVLDTGIWTQHPDLAANSFSGCSDASCDGSAYNKPVSFHGTHVTGTIAAVGQNDIGVVGVVPKLASVFGVDVESAAGTITNSAALAGMLSCEAHLDDLKAKDPQARMVVTMSYGGGPNTESSITRRTFERLYARGDMLFVASAGNAQITSPGELEYPAAYASVISVAAVDCNATAATFSQRNDDVELAAPGVNVLSTTLPYRVNISSVAVTPAGGSKQTLPSTLFLNSGLGNVSGVLVDCGLGYKKCPGARHKVCLIARGNTTFACKVNNAARAGCRAVLVYNNVDPPCTPLSGAGVIDPECPAGPKGYLPTVGLTKGEGQALQAMLKKGRVLASVSVKLGSEFNIYQTLDGTSMSAPHVTGVAARVWGNNPKCSNAQLRAVLQKSAKDLGADGRDPIYGYGLVQAAAAQALLNDSPCT